MPVCRLFIGPGGLENGRFTQGRPQYLQADGQAAGKAARDRDAADTGHIGYNGEDIGEVHL